MTIYDSGNAWAVFSKDFQSPHLAWFSLQSSLVWPPIFQTHPTTVSQQLGAALQSEPESRVVDHRRQEAGWRTLQDTWDQRQDLPRDLPRVTRLGIFSWCMWTLGPDMCHLHLIVSHHFKFTVQIINCTIKTTGIKTNCLLVQLHFKKDFRPRIHLLSNFTLFTALFF